MEIRISVVAVLLLSCASLNAQTKLTANTEKADSDSVSATATIEDFSWLRGYWLGEGFGGLCEEMWAPPVGGKMIGTFRLVQNDQLVFSEFFQLGQHESRWVLRLKHFDPELKGWEQKDEFVSFPLIRTDGRSAYFSGLTYRLVEQDRLEVFVAMRQKDGLYREEKIVFRRAKLEN